MLLRLIINSSTPAKPKTTTCSGRLRGGGGNFGIVTSFEFKLHELGPEVLSGLIIYPLSEARSALKKYSSFISGLSDDASVWAVMRKAPPLPFVPQEFHGKEIIVFGVFYAGDPQSAMKELEPVRHFGTPIAEMVGVQPYVGWQTAFDPLLTPGARNYWKSHNFTKFSDGLIDTAIEYASKLPDDQTELAFALLGGAINRIPVGDTAYGNRDAKFLINVHGRWQNQTNDDKCVNWARNLYKDLTPYATGSVYVNFLTGEETDRIKAAYGPNYDRLVSIKKKYDPNNFFRINQNIRPN